MAWLNSNTKNAFIVITLPTVTTKRIRNHCSGYIIFAEVLFIKNKYYNFIMNIFIDKVPEENKGVMTY